jgi:hypothetical protein
VVQIHAHDCVLVEVVGDLHCKDTSITKMNDSISIFA